MLMAMTEKNQSIMASDLQADRTEQLWCPGCKNRVFLKNGKNKVPHFAHYAKEACDTFSEGETLEHLNGKTQLYTHFKNLGYPAELEAYLKELKQRPDILMVVGEKKIAVEYQCSPLPIERMIERTVQYNRFGYTVCWILGEKLFRKGMPLTTLQKSFIQYSPDYAFYLLQYSSTKQKLILLSHLSKKYSQNWQYNSKRIKIQTLIQLLGQSDNTLSAVKSKVSKENVLERHKKLLRAARSSDQSIRSFCERLYINNETIMSMPIELYWAVDHEWLIETPAFEWKYLLLLWVESYPPRTIITYKKLQHKLCQWVEAAEVKLIRNVQLSPWFVVQVAEHYLDQLSESGVLKKIKKGKWRLSQFAERYDNEERKFQKLCADYNNRS